MVRALSHRNYRLFFAGQGISLVGTWITRVAMSWLVYRLTGSATVLGIVSFVGLIPTFALAPLAGVWGDRWSAYRVLVATQVLSMLQAFTVAWLALAGTISVGHILVLSALQGLINAFDTPARQTFVVDIVDDRGDLPSAIAMNSSMVNGARLVGPSIAGVLIAAAGEGWCFLLDGISYLAVIASLLLMRLERAERQETGQRVIEELRDGFRYAFGFPPIRSLLFLLALVSLTGLPFTVLMPVMASDALNGGPHTLGFLMGATGIGALGGAMFLASRPTVIGLDSVVARSASLFGFALIAFSMSRSFALSFVLMIVAGSGFMVQMAASNTLLHAIVREDMRGRLMAFYTMAFMGTAPFGSLLAGSLASRVGAPGTILAGGCACVLGGAALARQVPRLREMVMPIYAGNGMVPELASTCRPPGWPT